MFYAKALYTVTFTDGYTEQEIRALVGRGSIISTAVAHIFELDQAAVAEAWPKLKAWLDSTLGCSDDLEGILFLVGLHESGREFEPNLDKASKQRLVNEGTYCVLECLGCFERVGQEVDGYWIWEPHEDLPEDMSSTEQDLLLRAGILRYFDHYLNP
ncbi:MAG: hypothetical protein F4120_06020 [Rhodothermaceae bacterium]|nr:hypothetical protein [Rhodothermaceae bacterium]MYC03780.1 hypothetical protein [Rhodothermaceae bacterium]MYI17164.1 hypothetical protein [Rhodothermaceae bacterium]